MKICAVMVTYNPDSPLEQIIHSLLPHVDRLIVVDNSTEPHARWDIRQIAAACDFDVIWNKENLGLAAALNVGIRHALETGDYAWIATFDHDTHVLPGFRDAMLKAYLACPYRDRVGLIGPHHVLFPEDPAAKQLQGEQSPLFSDITMAMQSGSFFRAEALGKIGLFDESFFIDYVDIEYCLRLRKNRYRIIEATNAILGHRLGDPSRGTILGKTTTVYSHTPLRRYYAARNRLRMYPRYLFSDPIWICHDAWSWFKEVVKLLLFEQDRKQKLAYIARGVWDALRGRSGMYRKGTPHRA
jgi:rhamnosyltransferase